MYVRDRRRAQDAAVAGHERGEPAFPGMLTQVTISFQALPIIEEGFVQPSWRGGEKGRCCSNVKRKWGKMVHSIELKLQLTGMD